MEPERGRWKFETLDKYVSYAEQHNVEILLTLGVVPQWASSRPNEKAASLMAGAAAPPKSLDDWRDYVRTVATRYKGRIHSYEIWNEPNVSTFFSGSPQELATLTREASKVLKEVDPGNVVVSPSGAEGGIPWLNQFLAAGGGKWVDVIGYHFYVGREDPEKMIPVIKQVRSLMERYGLQNLPLWDTETGWLITNHQTEVKPTAISGGYSRVLSDDEASAFVARSYVIAWAYGLARFYWYSWDNGKMGLTEADGSTLKPPATAYGETEKWLLGARMLMCDHYGETWNCKIERPGGYSGWIVWNTSGPGQFALQPSWGVRRLCQLSGAVSDVTGNKSVQVGPLPVLLENRAP